MTKEVNFMVIVICRRSESYVLYLITLSNFRLSVTCHLDVSPLSKFHVMSDKSIKNNTLVITITACQNLHQHKPRAPTTKYLTNTKSNASLATSDKTDFDQIVTSDRKEKEVKHLKVNFAD